MFQFSLCQCCYGMLLRGHHEEQACTYQFINHIIILLTITYWLTDSLSFANHFCHVAMKMRFFLLKSSINVKMSKNDFMVMIFNLIKVFIFTHPLILDSSTAPIISCTSASLGYTSETIEENFQFVLINTLVTPLFLLSTISTDNENIDAYRKATNIYFNICQFALLKESIFSKIGNENRYFMDMLSWWKLMAILWFWSQSDGRWPIWHGQLNQMVGLDEGKQMGK